MRTGRYVPSWTNIGYTKQRAPKIRLSRFSRTYCTPFHCCCTYSISLNKCSFANIAKHTERGKNGILLTVMAIMRKRITILNSAPLFLSLFFSRDFFSIFDSKSNRSYCTQTHITHTHTYPKCAGSTKHRNSDKRFLLYKTVLNTKYTKLR